MKLTDDQKYNFTLIVLCFIACVCGYLWYLIDGALSYSKFKDIGSAKVELGYPVALAFLKLILGITTITLPVLSAILYFKRDLF